MPIQTLTAIRPRARAERHRNGAARVLTKMQRNGVALQKHFTRQGPVFSLASGELVPVDVAAVVGADIRVIPVNDGLFPDTAPDIAVGRNVTVNPQH